MANNRQNRGNVNIRFPGQEKINLISCNFYCYIKKTASKIFNQILNAIQYLHKNNVSHRDLKPENILMDFCFNVKLIDFGLSNFYKTGQLLSTACGSPCYASPLMVSGQKYDGFKTDIWSLGIILYAMLCGQLPFQQKTTKELYKKIIKGQYSMPVYLSNTTQQLLNKMIIKVQKRISLSEIRNHPCIYVGIHPMPIDLDLLKQIRKIAPFDLQKDSKLVIRITIFEIEQSQWYYCIVLFNAKKNSSRRRQNSG